MILRNLMTVGALLSMTSMAVKAEEEAKPTFKTNVRVRADSDQTSSKSTTSVTGAADVEKKTNNAPNLVLKHTRLGVSGELGNVSTKLVFRADKPTIQDFVDEATVSYKFMDNMSLTTGKVAAFAGGYDQAYSSFDRYFASNFAPAPDFGQGSPGTKLAPANDAGAQLDAKFGESAFTVQVLQGAVAQVGTATNAGGLTSSIKYQGNFMGIKPLIDYSIINPSSNYYTGVGSSSTSSGSDYSYSKGLRNTIGVGVEATFDAAVIMLDYDTATSGTYTKSTTGANANNDSPTNFASTTDTAMVAMVKYTVGEFTPFVKVVSESVKTGDATTYDNTTAGNITKVVSGATQTTMTSGLGVEYRPAKALRYHAVYIMKSDDVKSTSTSYKSGVAGTGVDSEVKTSSTQVLLGASVSI